MSELEIIMLAVGAFTFGYWRGVLSGYNTKVRDSDKSSIINVKAYKEKGQYLFYNMGTNQFLGQHTNEETGLENVRNTFPDSSIVYLRDESCDV